MPARGRVRARDREQGRAWARGALCGEKVQMRMRVRCAASSGDRRTCSAADSLLLHEACVRGANATMLISSL